MLMTEHVAAGGCDTECGGRWREVYTVSHRSAVAQGLRIIRDLEGMGAQQMTIRDAGHGMARMIMTFTERCMGLVFSGVLVFGLRMVENGHEYTIGNQSLIHLFIVAQMLAPAEDVFNGIYKFDLLR